MDNDELVTPDEAQRRLGIGPGAFRNLVSYYGIPRFKGRPDGRGRHRLLFRPRDLERLRVPVGRLLRTVQGSE